MIPKNELHAADLYEMSLNTLQTHLTLDINGYRCTSQMALSALVKAALDNSSLNAVCDDLSAMADANTIREQRNAALDIADLPRQESEMDAALAAGLPAELPQAGLEVAVDFHDEPFYGQDELARSYSCRGRAKKGTTRFLRIASASVIWRGLRLALALAYVAPGVQHTACPAAVAGQSRFVKRMDGLAHGLITAIQVSGDLRSCQFLTGTFQQNLVAAHGECRCGSQALF